MKMLITEEQLNRILVIENRKTPYDELKNIASKYATKAEFRKNNPNAYNAAQKRGILPDITQHMIPINKKYTNDELKNIALKYKHKIDFIKNDVGAYSVAKNRGILSDITTHMIPLGNLVNRLVYVYEFPETKTVYVGLTGNEDKRNYQHHIKNKNNKKSSPVFKYMEETGLTPIRKILSNGYINYIDAGNLEKESIIKYKNDGWTLLNTSCGGQFGTCVLKYTDDELRKIASKYSNKTDFKNGDINAYGSAVRRKILPDITQHMIPQRKYYTDDDLRDTSSKYSTKSDFRKNDIKSYNIASYRGILGDITKHFTLLRKSYTDDELKNIALKYNTKKDFYTNGSGDDYSGPDEYDGGGDTRWMDYINEE